MRATGSLLVPFNFRPDGESSGIDAARSTSAIGTKGDEASAHAAEQGSLFPRSVWLERIDELLTVFRISTGDRRGRPVDAERAKQRSSSDGRVGQATMVVTPAAYNWKCSQGAALVIFAPTEDRFLTGSVG